MSATAPRRLCASRVACQQQGKGGNGDEGHSTDIALVHLEKTAPRGLSQAAIKATEDSR
jgi:hypothetical protein